MHPVLADCGGAGDQHSSRSAVLDAQLLENPLQVLFDRSWARLEDDSDFRVRFAFSKPSSDLGFTRRESVGNQGLSPRALQRRG